MTRGLLADPRPPAPVAEPEVRGATPVVVQFDEDTQASERDGSEDGRIPGTDGQVPEQHEEPPPGDVRDVVQRVLPDGVERGGEEEPPAEDGYEQPPTKKSSETASRVSMNPVTTTAIASRCRLTRTEEMEGDMGDPWTGTP